MTEAFRNSKVHSTIFIEIDENEKLFIIYYLNYIEFHL